MQDNRHPFEGLPVSLRQTPEVVDAWLIDLSRRSNSGSHLHDAAPSGLKNENMRLLILGVLFLTAAGIIKPEVLLKFLPILLRAAIGVGA